MSNYKVGQRWTYYFLGQAVDCTIVKIRFFGLLHFVKYKACWDYGYPPYNDYTWKFRWQAKERI